MVGDVSCWNVVFGRGEEDFTELGFTDAGRGGQFKIREGLLRFASVGVPVRLLKVGVRDAGDLWRPSGERPPEIEQYREMVRAESREGGPVYGSGYFRSGY